VFARSILDSRGNPTVEVDVHAGSLFGRASVPSGASTGLYEAVELRDGGKVHHGLGVSNAINNVNRIISSKVKGMDVTKQEEIDGIMRTIDGTKDKSRLGANATLAVSLAVAKASALVQKKPLYKTFSLNKVMPIPMSNFVNGGKHAGSSYKVQEFLVLPTKAKSFSSGLGALSDTYHTLKEILLKKYGKSAINVGDEGGFVPPANKIEDILDLIVKAIEETGYGNHLFLGMDVAASEFYNWKLQKYNLEGKKSYSREELIDYYMDLKKKYPLISLEDPFDQDDFEAFKELTKVSKMQIVGDDLTVSNPERIALAAEDKLCNALLLKPNQIGTLTEAKKAASIAAKRGWKIITSHRSGDTEDTFIADLGVGIGANQVKFGAPVRGERTAKYNRLIRIEEEFKQYAKYAKF
jgi:enolase